MYVSQTFMVSPSILNGFFILETLGHWFSVICHPLQNGTSVLTIVRSSVCLTEPLQAFPCTVPLQQRVGEAVRTWAPSPMIPGLHAMPPFRLLGALHGAKGYAPRSAPGTVSVSVWCTPSTFPAVGTTLHILSIQTRRVGTASMLWVLGA